MKKQFLLITSFLIIFQPGILLAQDSDAGGTDQEFLLVVALIVLTLMVIVLIGVIFSLASLKKTLQDEAREAGAADEVWEEKPSVLARLWARLWDIKPTEEEEDILLEHNYDGIRELDNHLPPWWTYLFYLTIAFSIVYMLVYHVFESRPSSSEEYNIEILAAEVAAQARQAGLIAEGGGFDESVLEFTDDPAIIASGEGIFNMQCVACHRQDGGGSIGPNLTDEYWLHGGSINDIYNLIKVGVPDKGMISWEPVLSPEQIRDVSMYIRTLGGTNPENPREPQGTIYVEEPQEEEQEQEKEPESPEGEDQQVGES